MYNGLVHRIGVTMCNHYFRYMISDAASVARQVNSVTVRQHKTLEYLQFPAQVDGDMAVLFTPTQLTRAI